MCALGRGVGRGDEPVNDSVVGVVVANRAWVAEVLDHDLGRTGCSELCLHILRVTHEVDDYVSSSSRMTPLFIAIAAFSRDSISWLTIAAAVAYARNDLSSCNQSPYGCCPIRILMQGCAIYFVDFSP